MAFIHEEDSVSSDGQAIKEYHSKLVKADIHGKDQVSELVYLFDIILPFFGAFSTNLRSMMTCRL